MSFLATTDPQKFSLDAEIMGELPISGRLGVFLVNFFQDRSFSPEKMSRTS
jgi:hypothetical protein|tara:strand:+ start:612 stop:764 length:153 start_codon:yes stop_codon:yes gene_type:complete